MQLTKKNYSAFVKKVTDGFGDEVYRVKVLCFTGTHDSGDVLFLKDYATENAAISAAKRHLAKC